MRPYTIPFRILVYSSSQPSGMKGRLGFTHGNPTHPVASRTIDVASWKETKTDVRMPDPRVWANRMLQLI